MAQYGFTVNCDGNAVMQMKKIQETLGTMGITAVEQTEKAETGFTKLGNTVSETFGSIKNILLGGLGIGAAFEGIELIKDSKEYFDQNEQSIAKVNAALVSTKGIAGETAKHLADVATALDGKVIFDKTQIQDAQSMLLTFTAIRGEIYDKTLPAITDFATRFKMDLPSAANMLGKALNDPLKGMTRLQREGVVFSDHQKEMIKNFVKTGQVAKGQQVILDELKTEFGGLSDAMANTSEGKIEMAKKQWDDIKLKVGEVVSKIQLALIPIVGFLAKSIGALIGFFTSSSAAASVFRDVIIGIGAALITYYTYLGIVASWTAIVTAAQWAWNAAMAASPLSWIILGIVTLITAVMVLWDKFKGFREFLGGFWGGFTQALKMIVDQFIDFGHVVEDIFTFKFKKAFEDGKKAFADFKQDITTGMADAIKKGADAAGNSNFKFSNLLKFGGGAGETASQQSANSAAGYNGSAIRDRALKTSELSGAKGGLGEAKMIKVDIDTVMRVDGIKTGDAPQWADKSAQEILRVVNNLANGGSSTQ